jgi:RNA-directed DNA polymerase
MQEDGCVMATPREKQPSAVPAMAQQDGSALGRLCLWAELSVWTLRMLAALVQGVKGGKWFRLIDKVWSERNLRASYDKVAVNKGAPGVDHVTVEEFERELDSNVAKLAKALSEGSYEPQAIRRTFIPKPGSNEQRPLGILTVRDRVVQGAVRHVVEPISRMSLLRTATAFAPDGDAKTHCGGWMSC